MNLENLIEDKYMKGQMTFEEYEDALIEIATEPVKEVHDWQEVYEEI